MEADLTSWMEALDSLFARVPGRFGRVEPRRQARAYLTGLLAPEERKNGWQLAGPAADAPPDRMKRLINPASRDQHTGRDALRSYVVQELGHPGGVRVVDETGFIKKGNRPAGVQRQY